MLYELENMKRRNLFKIFSVLFIFTAVIFIITQLISYALKNTSNIKPKTNNIYENKQKVKDKYLTKPIEDFDMEDFYNNNIIHNNLNYIADIYPDFFEVLKSANITLPILDDMIPQGITIMKKYILITAYDYNSQKSSVVYVLDKIGNIINKVSLNNYSHVGSIIYDDVNNLIWIPDNNGILNAYNSVDFLNTDSVTPKYQFSNISEGLTNYNDTTKQEIAYLCIDNNMLYIGSFSNMGKGKIKKFQIINEQNDIKLELKKEFLCPFLVQGMTFYNDLNTKYLILSSSYGQKNDSHLEIYKFDDSKNDITSMKKIKLTLPPMLEQITIKRDNLYILFESKATKYQETLVKIEEICSLDIKKIIAKFDD